tara:strand:- start:827 stop:1075 length:249 start_codon:yes stop_codon:yes gene_type:complete
MLTFTNNNGYIFSSFLYNEYLEIIYEDNNGEINHYILSNMNMNETVKELILQKFAYDFINKLQECHIPLNIFISFTKYINNI